MLETLTKEFNGPASQLINQSPADSPFSATASSEIDTTSQFRHLPPFSLSWTTYMELTFLPISPSQPKTMAASTSLRPPTLPLPRASASLHPTKLPFSFNPNTKLTASKHPASPLPLKVLCSRNSKEVRFRPGKPDPVYKNRLVTMLVNRVMKGGKKSLAYHIIYLALKRIRAKTASSATNPLLVLRDAIREVTPDVTVKARRVGGSTHQVPVEVGSGQGKAIAIRWLLEASRKRQGKSMVLKLSDEVMDAARGTGDAVRMKEAAHKMAEANRAFAHFR